MFTTLYRWKGRSLLVALSHGTMNWLLKPRTKKLSQRKCKGRKITHKGSNQRKNIRKKMTTRNTGISLLGHTSSTMLSFCDQIGSGIFICGNVSEELLFECFPRCHISLCILLPLRVALFIENATGL